MLLSQCGTGGGGTPSPTRTPQPPFTATAPATPALVAVTCTPLPTPTPSPTATATTTATSTGTATPAATATSTPIPTPTATPTPDAGQLATDWTLYNLGCYLVRIGEVEPPEGCPVPADYNACRTAEAECAQRAGIQDREKLREYQNKYDRLILNKSATYKPPVPADLFKGLLALESQLVPDIPGGIAQLDDPASKIDDYQPGDEYNPEKAIPAGMAFLRGRYDRIVKDDKGHNWSTSESEKWKFALAAYNGGDGTVYEARKYAESFGLDPTKWSDMLEPREGMVYQWIDENGQEQSYTCLNALDCAIHQVYGGSKDEGWMKARLKLMSCEVADGWWYKGHHSGSLPRHDPGAAYCEAP